MPSVIRGSDNFDTAGGNAVKAWVNFNGTGTVAIRASFNVSSITDNGTGDYTVNFATALADANYGIGATGYQLATGGAVCVAMAHGAVYTTNAVRVFTTNSSFTNTDMQNVSVEVFR